MLRRTVTGFRALRQWGPRSSRRKLYHNQLVPDTSFHPYTDFYTTRDKIRSPRDHGDTPNDTSGISRLEELLANEAPRKQDQHKRRSTTRHGGALANEVYIRELPASLKHALSRSCDSHMRLEILLRHKDPLRVYYPTLEKFVQMEFGVVDSMSELCLDNRIGPDLIVRLVRYLLLHKRFDQVASIYLHMTLDSFPNLELLDKINEMVFMTLREDHDLEIGFQQLMKCVFIGVNGDVKIFKHIFSNVTNNGETLTRYGFQHPRFLNLLRVLQLEALVNSCSDVEVLPPEYKETDLDFVNLSLALRMIKSGRAREALLHLQERGILSNNPDGLFHRLVYQAQSDSPLTSSEISRLCLSFFKRCRDVKFGLYDRAIWSRVTNSQNYHRKSLKLINDTTLQNQLISDYLKKLLKQRKLGLAKVILSENCQYVNDLNINNVVSVLLLSRDSKLLESVVTSLTPMRRNLMFDLAYIRIISSRSKQLTPPDSLIKDVEWLLQGFDYRITDSNMFKMNSFMASLPESLRHGLLSKIKGPTTISPYTQLVKACRSVDTTLVLIQQGNIFKSRSELLKIGQIIANYLSNGQIIEILQKLYTSSQPRFHSLHQKVTMSLISTKEFERCNTIINACPETKSIQLLNNALLLDNPSNVTKLIQQVTINTPKQQHEQLTTFKRLMDTPNAMPYCLSRDVKRVLGRSSPMNKATTVMLVKHTIDGIKKRNEGNVIATDRLKWALAQCARYKVPKSVIHGLVD